MVGSRVSNLALMYHRDSPFFLVHGDDCLVRVSLFSQFARGLAHPLTRSVCLSVCLMGSGRLLLVAVLLRSYGQARAKRRGQ
jgi:hypothetical protein